MRKLLVIIIIIVLPALACGEDAFCGHYVDAEGNSQTTHCITPNGDAMGLADGLFGK